MNEPKLREVFSGFAVLRDSGDTHADGTANMEVIAVFQNLTKACRYARAQAIETRLSHHVTGDPIGRVLIEGHETRDEEGNASLNINSGVFGCGVDE